MNPKEDNKTTSNNEKKQNDAATNLIRQKIANIHQVEPSAKEELKEVGKLDKTKKVLSKHQKYMDDLSKSGRGLAEIQAAWHKYYQNLSDIEKHSVWQEFYDQHARKRQREHQAILDEQQKKLDIELKSREEENSQIPPHRRNKQPSKKEQIIDRVASRAKKSKKHSYFHSLVFGLSMGSVVIFILLFSFFNERFITPFIRPSQNVSATPIIIDPTNPGKVGPEPKIVIPKINVEAPVVYDAKSIDDEVIQKALQRGVVHYPITPNPGEKGNAVIFGHSSSNIFNSGNYKFAFLLLKGLENGDTFYVQKDGKRYVYKVFNKYITSPTDLSVLNPTDRPATMTLITCDPPGLSTNRLIIQAEQIYPDPSADTKSSVNTSSQAKPAELPSNSPSLWQRIKGWL